MTGRDRIPRLEPGHHVHLHQAARSNGRRSQQVAGRDDGQAQARFPVCSRSCGRSRCCEISTGRTSQNQGQYAYAVSGVNPAEVYDVGAEADGEADARTPASLTVSSDFYQQHAEPGHRHPARSGQDLRRFRGAHPDAAAQRVLAELRLPDQEARGSVPGDPGDGRRARARSPKISRCSTSSPTTGNAGAARRAGHAGRRRSARRP